LLRIGSLTETYTAQQVSLGRTVMVKILRGEFQANAQHREAFVRGARIHAGMEHPHIAPIYDYGQQDGLDFAVFRLMQPDVLKDQLQAGPIPLPNAIPTIRQIASALEYLHACEMTHGDPSISNIVFDDAGNAYIANFHMAGYQPQQGFSGTPSFTAPEKWMDNRATPLTDQYALGCIAYYLITGQFPFFKSRSMVDFMRAHLEEMPPLPQEFVADLPLAVNDVITRALSKKPEDRYPTVVDFAREFEKAAQDVPRHLFISYSRRDKEYAQHLSDHLRYNGFEVWIDSQIDYGDAWFDEIEDAIKTCAAFVLVMSPESKGSEWVKKEILLAKRFKKPIFPLLLEGQEFGIVIDIQFADVQDGQMPDTNFHRRLRRSVYGEV
ncbi:MAG: TIR domain-containing protein, partial [Anaerolineae bacterium]|nr:TIR domain-containing protein [Anaerolineae bacterium]